MRHITHAAGRYRLKIEDKYNLSRETLDHYVTEVYDLLGLTVPAIVTVDTDRICICVCNEPGTEEDDKCIHMFYPGAGNHKFPDKLKDIMAKYHNWFPNKSSMYVTLPKRTKTYEDEILSWNKPRELEQDTERRLSVRCQECAEQMYLFSDG